MIVSVLFDPAAWAGKKVEQGLRRGPPMVVLAMIVSPPNALLLKLNGVTDRSIVQTQCLNG